MTTNGGAKGAPSRPRRLTITDVARAAGVSISVVSYALNDRPGVSDATRRHVLRIASDLGWRPSAAARSLRSQTRSLAVLLPGDAPTTSALDVATGLQSALADAGVAVCVEVAPDRAAAAARLDATWTEGRHAGFVATDLLRDDPRVRTAERVGAPLVRVAPGPHPPHSPVPSGAPADGRVWFDGWAEGDAARYVVGLGHRRLALFVRDERLEGARCLLAGLADAADRVRATVEVVEYGRVEETSSAAARLLATPLRPTMVVTDDDLAALAVLEAARRRGLRVPWDVSVLAGEDSPTCRLLDPPLTAVARPHAALGPRVAAALAPALKPAAGPTRADRDGPGDAEPDTPAPVAARLLIRGSTAPPAA
ncbi:LacI family transcriptional regulator [Isoptericola sp. NEAU-Y5]|uniref:LacI family transcriptional regulator n=1 Tax=Isoptericola luteus TaxID=2879484 RepID=A0ABS7ZGB3_9MICO|nr:LacI family DNA-binding transcriptional regulator [Isoptericola sp. NEAU-Y5]MCA5893346.1 LacI family transcriptional regulator [Isoptericola sp. NEAU-Y5]